MASNDGWYSIKVQATVSMLPTSESGRDRGITSGYRPNHNFGSASNSEMRMGQITVDKDEWIEPGESKETVILFAMPEGYLIDLKPGLVWRIQEGSKLVATGKINKILSSDVPTR